MTRVGPQHYTKIKCLHTERAALCGALQGDRTDSLTDMLTYVLSS